MSSKTFTRSYAAGEIAELLSGRLDLVKFQTGLRKCLNFEVTPQGPIQNRPGFAYVQKVKVNGAALIPFSYNSQQSFALEMGNGYIRFHTLGGTLLEAAKVITGITQAAPGVFTSAAHGFANGDWVQLAGIAGMTALNGRWGIVTAAAANTYSLTDLFGTAISTAALAAYTGGGTVSRVYEVATSPYLTADLFNLHYVQSADVLTIAHQTYTVRELRRLGATNWTLTAPSFVPTIPTPAAPALATVGPGGGTPTTHIYVTTAIASNTLEESLPSPSANVAYDLTVAGNSVTILAAAVAGAVRYNVYKQKAGLFGYIGQTDGSVVLSDNNIDPDMSKTPPLPSTPFAAENPQAVSYFEQRRVFGGGGVNPQRWWATRSATESNMTYSIPSQDDDAITARIVAREANVVRHLVPFNELLALTSGGVWRLSPTGDIALAPSTTQSKQHSAVGASMVQPILTSASVLYVPARGAHMRELTYKWQTQRYEPDDVSVLAPHLFDYKSIVQLAYSQTPQQTLWAVRSDGILLGMTHQPEHEVKAWHQHDTQGLFKSVCAIPEGDEDGVYAIIERTVNGQTVQYIERKHTRQFTVLKDAFFVDCGLTYSGAAVSTITGLWHLEGKSVVALADGGVEPAQPVVNGSITLTAPASTVHVGLSYNSDAQTLPLTSEAMQAYGQGVVKNVNEVALSVYQSSSIKSGPSFDKLTEYPQRLITDPYGTPPGMVSTVVRMKLTPSWQEEGLVCVRQSAPLPLTLRAMTIEVATGG